jgi:glutathione S-transferase
MQEKPVLYGAAYSVYVRICRLALAEKGVDYDHVEIDIFAAGGPPADYQRRHPFGRIPAFEHAGFSLYESSAIARYIDEAFPGPALQPATARARARLNQIVSIFDNYGYRPMVWDIYVERVSAPKEGRASDEVRIAQALPRVAQCLQAVEELMGDRPWLAGDAISLADLHAAPMIHYLAGTSEGASLLRGRARLQPWWERLSQRPSMQETQP